MIKENTLSLTVNRMVSEGIHEELEWLPDLELQRVGSCAITIRFWREDKGSRWEVREVARDKGVKEEDAIQVMDDPDMAQYE